MIKSFGDSFSLGVGTANPYPATVSSWLGSPCVNFGVSSSQIADQAILIYGCSFNSDDIVLFLTGFNDMRFFGADSATYSSSLLAVLAWAGSGGKISARQTTQFGAWNDTPVNSVGRYTTVVGARMSANIAGPVVYIGSIIQTVNPNGTFRVSVDGIDRGVFSCLGGRVAGSGRNYSPFLIRIDGLSNVSHLVEIEVLSGQVFIDWMGGCVSGPRVMVGECPSMQASAYSMYAPFNNGSPSIVEQYKNVIKSVCVLLATDGLRLQSVPVKFDPDSQAQGDQVHPNESGQSTIAFSFLKAIG